MNENYYKVKNRYEYNINFEKFIKVPNEQIILQILSCFNIYDYDENTEFSGSDHKNILPKLKQLDLVEFITVSYYDYVIATGFQEVVRMLRRFLHFINYGLKVRKITEDGNFTHFSLYNHGATYHNKIFYRKSVTISKTQTRQLKFD